RDSIYLINVIARSQATERQSLGTLESLQISTRAGTTVPLLSFATIGYDLEQPIIWRRDRESTVTVRAVMIDETQPTTAVAQLAPTIEAFRKTLPEGYRVTVGGTVEDSAKSQGPILSIVPLMLLMMAIFLMAQLQSFQKLFLVVSVAPLGLIGVVAALLASGKPMGFVAILGILALI